MGPRITATALAVALATLGAPVEEAPDTGSPPGPVGSSRPLRYRPPVIAPVVDGFRPPATPFGPGNRGLEYAPEPGTGVSAIERGTVTFAGAVAGTNAVSVLHPDGLRSSYTGLASIAVSTGQALKRGGAIGTSRDRLHLGVRAGTAYLDPATLFVTGARAHLVPVHSPADRRARPAAVGP